jgi:hypothetical protein
MNAKQAPAGFGRTAAAASWVVPVAGMVGTGLLATLHAPGVMFLWSALASLAMLASVGLGIAALTRITKEGRRGILVPALVGLGINSLLVVFAVLGFMAR